MGRNDKNIVKISVPNIGFVARIFKGEFEDSHENIRYYNRKWRSHHTGAGSFLIIIINWIETKSKWRISLLELVNH